MGLLFFGAKLDDHRADHVDAERHDPWRTGDRALFVENMLLHGSPAGAALLHRPARRQPALVIQGAHPQHLVGFAHRFALVDPVRDVLRQIGLEKCAHLLAERHFLGAEMNIHLIPQ
ncbi:hypothetical protein D3C84_973240 [compost metagenome]